MKASRGEIKIADILNKCTRSNISHILNNKSWKE